ncbi:MAG: TonB-dependent receptor [SAR86 cluster bacterium]|uniref:TonB-dependent receptor n=1 Tax=SAR86 cluster bacterium TaxID=2030880 RepID=A0A937SFY8_9GAMM|nr:TonB-dependent receptor [SAR86 cluster bacterium]
MLNRNIFFTLVFGFFASTSVYADNPGTEEVAATPVAETSDVQEEVAMEASVSETPSSAADDSDSVELTKVSVTGSRIKRTDIEGPQPLVVITSDDIDQGGFLSVYEAVAALSQNTGQTVMDGLGGGTNNASQNTINLRDFGPSRTLVLVNGKRRANYPYPSGGDASFNWNRIPVGIVERIEILTAGASAIYGADAVSGVINIILVDGMEDFSVQVRYGEHQPATGRESGESVAIEMSGGKYFDNGSIVFGFETNTVNPINGKDRPMYDTRFDEPVGYYQYGSWAGYLSGGGQAFLPEESGALTTCEDINLESDAMENYGWGTEPYTDPSGDVWGPQNRFGPTFKYCNLDASAWTTVRNGYDNNSAYFAGTYTLENGIQLNADVHYWDTELKNDYYPYFVQASYDGRAAFTDDGGIIAYSDGTPGAAAEGRSMAPAMFDYGVYVSGQRFFPEKAWRGEFEEKTLSYTLTASSTFELQDAIWDWELAYVNDSYDYLTGGQDVLNDSLERWMCGGVADTQYASLCTMGSYGYQVYNPDTFWGSYETAASYGLWQRTYIEGESSSETLQFTTSGELFTLPAGPVGFALHLEDTTTDYNIDPGPQYDAGNVWGNSTTKGGGERTRTSYAVETAIPVTANFDLYLARRSDSYDEKSTQIGDRTTDQITFTWKPIDRLLIRGGWGESFAAPSLPYIYKGVSGSFGTPCDYYGRYLNEGVVNLDGTSCLSGGYTQLNANISSSGNLNLRAETGEQYSLGMVLDIMNTSKVRASMTLDLVEIELNNIVTTTSTSQVLRDEMICKAQEDGITTDGYSFSSSYCTDIYATIVRGAIWTPQGGMDAPDITPPEGAIDTVSYGYINGAGRYYRGADWGISSRFITDEMGDFFLSLSVSYVDDERRKDTDADPYVSIMNQERRLRSRSYLSLSWTKDDWSTGVSTSRIGSMGYFSSFAPNPSGRNKIEPYFDIGAFVRYDIEDGHYIGLSVSNLMDDAPTYNTDLGFPWFSEYYYSAVGREVFVTYKYTF